MLIAILGSQGVGKSTLLNQLAMHDYTVDSYKVSRSVQKEMGYQSLSEAVETFSQMRDFQENVIQRKYSHDLQLSLNAASKDVVLVERSFYDILAYAELWTEHFAESNSIVSSWLDGYKQACIQYQREIYDGLILVEPNSHITFENDPERACEKTQKRIDLRLKELCSYTEVPILHISEFDLRARVNSAINFISKL